MIKPRSFFAAMILLGGCISRGTTPPDPTADVPAIDMTTPPGDMTTPPPTDTPLPRDRGMCPPRPTTREDSATECGDGLDNDCNGFTDCEDFNCRTCAVPRCLTNNTVMTRDGGACMCRGTENTTAACSDGEDNDCDGFTDCQAFSCQICAVPMCLRDGGRNPGGDAGFCTCRGVVENTNEACTDGIDNDCNGFTDCRDFGCSRSDGGVTVCATDAGTPRPDAGRCDSGGALENTPAACNDGIDNDCNGFTDCRDNNCSCQGTCMGRIAGCTCMGAENTNATCSDRIDNDCDGFTDCGPTQPDFGCTRNPEVTVCGGVDAGMRD